MWNNSEFAIVSLIFTVLSAFGVYKEQKSGIDSTALLKEEHETHLVTPIGGEINGPDKRIVPTIRSDEGGALLHVANLYFVIDEEEEQRMLAEQKPPSFFSWLRVGMALGSALFLLHLLFSGHGTIARLAGYHPFPASLLVIIFFSISILSGSTRGFHNCFLAIFTLLGGLLVALTQGPACLFGGCLLALTMSPWWHLVILRISYAVCGRTFFVGILWYLLLAGCTFVSASNLYFPLSVIFRGRLWLIMIMALCPLFATLGKRLILFNVLQYWQHSWPSRVSIILLFLIVLIGIIPSTIARSMGEVRTEFSNLINLSPPVSVVVNSFDPQNLGHRYVAPPPPPVSSNGSAPLPFYPSLTAVLINARQGYGISNTDNFELILSYLEQLQPDLVAVVESECNRLFVGTRDLVEYLAYNLQYYNFVALSPSQSSWGIAVLSSFEFDQLSSRLLVQDDSIGVALAARFFVDNGTAMLPMNFVVSEFQGKSDSDTLGLTDDLREFVEPLIFSGEPVLMMGGFHAPPSSVSDPLKPYFADASYNLHKDQAGDYSLSRHLNVSSCSIDTSNGNDISDHSPMVTNFQLGVPDVL